MDFSLIQGVCDLVREDAGRQAGYNLLGLLEMCGVKDVVVDKEVVAEKRGLN